MRFFITGADGFVGRQLAARCEARGDEALGSDRELDVANLQALAARLADVRPDVVVHLAALSSVAGSLESEAECYRTNVGGTRALLAAVAAEAPSARVFITGSGEQYGPQPADAAPVSESTPLRPRSPYARSKRAAEAMGFAAAARGLDIVQVRSFNHTGAGQDDRFVASSFARQAAAIADGRSEPLLRVGNLASVRDFLDVDDVLDAYLALIDRGKRGRVYNVASGRGVAIQWILDTLLDLAGIEPRVEVDSARHRPSDSLVGDSTKLRHETGWRPQRDMRDTFAALLESWRQRDA